MGHENGGKQRLAKRRHVKGMLDETDPLIIHVQSSFGLCSFILLWVAPHTISSFIWRKSTLNVTLNPMLLFTGISLAARLSFSPAGVEKVSDHGTIGPRKYFGFQKETLQTEERAM